MGGMDLGFQRAGIRTVLATDIDPRCIETLKANGPTTTLLPADLHDVDGITLLAKAGLPPLPPEPTHAPKDTPGKGRKVHVTAGEAIGTLDDGVDMEGVEAIGGMYGHLMDAIPAGMNYLYYTKRYNPKKHLFRWRSKFWTFLLKMDPSRPSHTIQATPGPYVGPFHWRNRRLTLEEIKRLQGIPASWTVSGSTQPEYTSAAWRQVGNAVPPRLAEAIAAGIKDSL